MRLFGRNSALIVVRAEENAPRSPTTSGEIRLQIKVLMKPYRLCVCEARIRDLHVMREKVLCVARTRPAAADDRSDLHYDFRRQASASGVIGGLARIVPFVSQHSTLRGRGKVPVVAGTAWDRLGHARNATATAFYAARCHT